MPKSPKDYGPISIARDTETTEKIALTTRLTIRPGVIRDDIMPAHREAFMKAARGRKAFEYDEWVKQGGINVVSKILSLNNRTAHPVFDRHAACAKATKLIAQFMQNTSHAFVASSTNALVRARPSSENGGPGVC